MPTEIERKFLVRVMDLPPLGEHHRRLLQGYLARGENAEVRVRIEEHPRRMAWIQVKSRDPGLSRAEYTQEIPMDTARELLGLREGFLIEKTRQLIRLDDLTWEVDRFAGANLGLVIAEVELSYEDQDFTYPAWISREVTGEKRFYNADLARHPFTRWSSKERMNL